MAKFDVYCLGDSEHYVVDCQADLLRDLNTRLVVPLMPVDAAPKQGVRLNPVFEINGQRYAMVTQFAATIARSNLREIGISLGEHDIAIGNALDMLISGF